LQAQGEGAAAGGDAAQGASAMQVRRSNCAWFEWCSC
jgi:hypothetical protein